ncbi:MAG TPA: hypothetical protein VFE47_27770 [Tepidisphaeraceae bacterium]|jgi:hypothetical protein|nr:hypothetical protein [Tepidisphaeraceae bacterium]
MSLLHRRLSEWNARIVRSGERTIRGEVAHFASASIGMEILPAETEEWKFKNIAIEELFAGPFALAVLA